MEYREKIIAAMKEMAFIRGFSRVTVDELAGRTGISKRTIYRYFDSKNEIVSAVLEDFMSAVEMKVQQVLDSPYDPVKKIENVVHVVSQSAMLIQSPALYDLQKHYPGLWDKIEQFRAQKVQLVFEKIITDNIQDNFRAIEDKIFTTALLASIKAVINPSFILENNLTLKETIQVLFTIFMHGIVKEAPGA